MLLQLRVRVAHHLNDEVSNLVEKWTFEAERVMSLVDRTSHDFSQNVVTPFVAGQNSISN